MTTPRSPLPWDQSRETFSPTCSCPPIWHGIIPPYCPIHNPGAPSYRTFTTTGTAPGLRFDPDPLTVPELPYPWPGVMERLHRRQARRRVVAQERHWLLLAAIAAAAVGVLLILAGTTEARR